MPPKGTGRYRALEPEVNCAEAALWTDRCNDQAMRARQASTQAPKKPRAAPTQMKTVPSGRLDFCINAAALVSGTMSEGTV